MKAIRYIGSFQFIPTYIQRIPLKSVYAKFHQDGAKTRRLISVKIEEQTDRRMERRTDKPTD